MRPFHSSLRLLAALTLSLSLIGCGGGGGGGGDNVDPLEPTLTERPRIVSTIPARNAVAIPTDSNIKIQFDTPIDAGQDVDSYFVIEADGDRINYIANINPDRSVVLLPERALPYGADVTIRVVPGLRNTDGEARTSTYEFEFATEINNEVSSIPHENVADPVELMAMKMDQNGDGMSILRQSGGSPRTLYRELRAGRPYGPVKVALLGKSPFIEEDNVHLFDNGDVQLTYERSLSGRPNLFTVRYVRATDTWLPELHLTSNNLRVVTEFASAHSPSGSVIAWIEQVVTDSTKQAVRVGFPQADGTMGTAYVAGIADTTRSTLRMHKQGELTMIAWSEATSVGEITSVLEHRESTGFSSVMPVSPVGKDSKVHQVIASQGGHRYVLFEEQDSSDAAQGQLSVAYGGPGAAYSSVVALHSDYARVHFGRMVTTPLGVMTAMYGIEGVTPGTWSRRFTPGAAVTAPFELTGENNAVLERGQALSIDSEGNVYALLATSNGFYHQLMRASLLPANGTPPVVIAIDVNVRAPATSSPRIDPLASGGVLLSWIVRVDSAGINYDVRSRTLSAFGQLGDKATYAVEGEAVITKTAVGIAQTGIGTLLFAEQSPFDVYEVGLE